MAITLVLKNKKNNSIKLGILGFSWTTLFFGGFVPFFRGDWKTFLILLICYIFTLSNSLNVLYSFVVHILGAFFYNRIYTQYLVNQGYVPMNEEGITLLKIKGIMVHSMDWPQ